MSMSPDPSESRVTASQFSAAIQKLVKKPCLAYDLGPVSGSPVVDLHFGKPIRGASQAGDDEALSLSPQGELSLYVACAWRLESREQIVCGCWDDQSPEGQMRTGLDQLVGHTVRRVMAVPPAWDLAIEFDNGLLLRVFCDQTNDDEGADNYALYTGAEIFTVATLSDLFVSPRDAEGEHNRD
jgi:hypothetical protein